MRMQGDREHSAPHVGLQSACRTRTGKAMGFPGHKGEAVLDTNETLKLSHSVWRPNGSRSFSASVLRD